MKKITKRAGVWAIPSEFSNRASSYAGVESAVAGPKPKSSKIARDGKF